MFHFTGKTMYLVFFLTMFICIPCVNAQLKARYAGVTFRLLGTVGYNTVRIKRDPTSGNLYVLQNNGIIQRVNFNSDTTAATLTTVYQTSNHHLNAPLGMTFGSDGTMYLVGNDSTTVLGTASIVKGIPVSPGSENRTWSMIATTVPYPYGNVYNHRMSGIVLNPTGDSIYVNSGAATDHGEVENGGYRESGLTSIVLRLPIDGDNIVLQNDRDWLRSNGYLLCEGIRNTFDLAYAGNGDLFGVENSGDRDDPEELNWIRAGHHYGFPWRISTDLTPQQFTPYDPHTDPLLSPNAWGGGNLYKTFSNDTAYPQAPDSITFTYPIPSYGPDADHFRDTTTGQVEDASQLGKKIYTFTPHRSPDGIVFDRDSLLAGNLQGGGLVICLENSALITALGDTSQDLLLVELTKDSGNYSAHVIRLVSGFLSPLGEELVGNKLFVVETGLNYNNNSPRLWEITLPLASTTAVRKTHNAQESFELDQNYPNPFNPSTVIKYQLPQTSYVSLKVYDVLGRERETLVNARETAGTHSVAFNAATLPSGVYFYKLQAGDYSSVKKAILMK
ncbi:MAG TPA: T9SS type A sorting domain-containing protein [Candidatus Acidoferrales bacterium]|nr:T9SS type A sorting domain-containing protein [Candidatus Acidoferrales bacterium]